MTTEEFLLIAYEYFPKGIDAMNHYAYVESPEAKKLRGLCNELFNKEQNGGFDSLHERFKEIDISKHFHNATLFNIVDRCFNLQLAELKGDKYYSICLNVSAIVPYYLVYVLETTVIEISNPDNFGLPRVTHPVRNREMEVYYKSQLDKMSLLAEDYFKAQLFPEELLDIVVPDVSFDLIRAGKFTFFNAFFLDEYHRRL